MDSVIETIIMAKARFLAEIHIGDNDELGEIARDLMGKIDKVRPDIITGIEAEKECNG